MEAILNAAKEELAGITLVAHTWKGIPLNQFTREELMKIIGLQAQTLLELHERTLDMFEYLDDIKCRK